MSNFSTKSLRLAMMDGLKQEDERSEARLSERLRNECAAMFLIQRNILKMSKELLLVQRRIAALSDAIAIEETERPE